MITKVYGVYDTKGMTYFPPMCHVNAGTAIRWFTDLAADTTTNISRHPSDYMLMEIGTFNDNTGEMVSLKVPLNLGFASDYNQPKIPLGNELGKMPLVESAAPSNSPSNGKTPKEVLI